MIDGLIAIVGAACRFPGAPSIEAFWELLVTGTDAISEVDGRWSTRFYYHPNQAAPGKSYTWWAGLIDGAELFEPAFFGISPREAAQMDPQQRLLLELAWHAAEDAGIPTARLAGSDTGVYIGASSTDYRDLRLGDPSSGDSYFMTGGTLSILSNRISYVFDLRGPSLTVDTACSSSLVALHHACEAIRDGRIESAIVGGINLLLAPYPFLGFCRASMLSRRGRCFAFDERADGYVRGEGGGVVILKPLRQALADGDRIRAVIRGTGVNSDGRTIGLSLPSHEAQASLIRTVCDRAGVAPDDLAFFEMHGTGTPAGDPIEATAVGRALGNSRGAPLPIGSVKTNIGHLEPASGMAGLIKTALALDNGVLPPTLHCETPNPRIPFGELNLRLIGRGETIEAGNAAGINSFGFGGTNAHAVLSAPPKPVAPAEAGDGALLPPLVISARTKASLRAVAQDWSAALAAAPTPERAASLVRAAARRRDQHSERLVVSGEDGADAMAAALADFAAGADTSAAAAIAGTAARDGKLAFVFAGNGAQWPDMGRATYRRSAAFREAIAGVDDALRPMLGWSVAEAIEQGVAADELVHADVAQPLLFAIQVAIVTVLRRLGVGAAGHIGHSVGEIAAAWAAGALTLAQAARVVVARSRQQERTRGNGRMAALALGAAAAEDLLAEIGSSLEVGAINATQSVTVSGPEAALERLGSEAKRRGIAFRPLDLEFAFHSAAMDPIRDDLLAALPDLESAEPATLLVSTVTGEAVTAGLLDNDYWWRNIRSPVRFTEGMAALVADGCRIFLEIGPNPVLQAYLHDALRTGADGQGRVVATLSRKEQDDDPFARVAARCHVAGYDITGAETFDGPQNLSGLPRYKWQREPFWFARTVEAHTLVDPEFEHPLLGFRQTGPVVSWLNHLDPQVTPWLADHAVDGVPVLPAAAVLEMALAAARSRRPGAAVIEVGDVELRRPLPFDAAQGRELRSTIAGEDGDWELGSRPRLADDLPTLHAVARLVTAGDPRPALSFPGIAAEAAAAANGEVDAASLYRLADRLGLQYGERFRTVERIELLGADEAIAWLDAGSIGEPTDPYLIHPALLDGALQGLLALIAARGADLQGASLLPWRFGRVRVLAPFGRVPRSARLRITRLGVRSASADIALFDDDGKVVGELSDCWFRRVELSRASAPEDSALHVDLVPAPLAELRAPAVLAEIGGIVRRLAAPASSAGKPDELGLLFEAMVAAIGRDAVLEIVDRDAPFAVEDIVAGGLVAPEAETVFLVLLRLLARFGAASEREGEWRLAASDDLPDVADVWRLLLAESPDLVAELALAAAAAAELPQLLKEGPRLPDGAVSPMTEHLLYGSPVSVAGIDALCEALGAIAARWPDARPLRILELGADAAAITRRVLDRLAQSGVALDYRATYADPEPVARLAPVVAAVPGASAACWSPEDGTGDIGGGDGGHFDIILVTHSGVRRRLDPAVLSRLREHLAPGGLFVALEATPNALWDLVFGRSPGWWQAGHGADAEWPSPLRSADDWCNDLIDAGFAGADAVVLGRAWPSAVVWAHTERESEAPKTEAAAAARSVAAIDDARLDAAAISDALRAAGHIVRETNASGFAAADEDAATAEVALFVLDPVAANAEVDAVAAAERLLPLLTRVAAAAAQRRVALWVVTSGAQQESDAGENGPLGAALWGFARVLVNEMPGLSLRLIDLAPAMDAAQRGAALAAELAADSAETEIVWTPAGRHVLRLRRGLPPRWAQPQDAIALTAAQQGGLDTLGWQPATQREPGFGEITIDVRAAGLNFRDIMWAMGLVPEEALIDGFTGPTFGLECAGIVRSVGEGVAHLAVGDRVAGFAPASLASEVTTAAHAVTRLPPDTSFAEAATIPVTFVTVIYALGTLAQLAADEVVLIHAAAGGVGLAAIQYAKYRGAVVIATAGSEVKRSFLRLAGGDHVLDSRSLGFADAVRAITGGRGVDVVLNSLSGEAMEQSLGVLKPFGRFLELGKRDFYLNRRIHLRPLRQNISYFAIDVDQLPVQRPDLAKSLLDEVARALADGAIRPLAHRSFPFAAAADAFRLMQASGHIGKLVLVPDGNAGIRLRQPAVTTLRRDGTYLVTGGISGFGFAAARWLAERGAGSIALIGRRGGATPGAEERVAELAALGTEVRVYAGDVSDPASLAAALRDIRATQPSPLRGIVHAASAITDAMAADVDAAAIADQLRPKLRGAILLDRLTRDDPIDLFVMFSSATTLLGAPGQSVYVAGNMAIEALARQRRAAGLPALAVAWGPIEDAGYLAERPETRDALARRLGAKPMPAAQALAGLAALLDSGLPVAGLAETSWSEARRYLPILAAPLFSEIRADSGASPADDSLLERLGGVDGEEALALLKTVIAEEAANILRLPAGALDPLRPLSEVGMDSLMAIELRLALESRLRVDLPLMSLAEGTSVASIATRLANAVSSRPRASDLVSLAERYEVADEARQAAAAHAAEEAFDPDDVTSAAAE